MRVVERTWGAPIVESSNAQVLRRTVQRVVLNTLLDRAGDKQALAEVLLAAEWALTELDRSLAKERTVSTLADDAQRAAARREIARYFAGEDDPVTRSRFRVIPLPWP